MDFAISLVLLLMIMILISLAVGWGMYRENKYFGKDFTGKYRKDK